MIDKFTLFLPHLLMAIAIWRLLRRADLDGDPSLPGRTKAFRTRPASGDQDRRDA